MRFNLESPIMVGLTKAYDVCLTAVYFLLCCIPVVTVGASLSALSFTMMSISSDECGGVTRMFFGTFRKEFKQATLAWLVMLAAGLVLVGDIYACWVWAQTNTAFLQVMRGMTVFFVLLYFFVSEYLYAGIAKFVVTFGQAFHNALVFAFTNLGRSVLQTVLLALTALALYLFEAFALPVIPVCAYLQAKLRAKAFAAYLSAEPAEDGGEEEESI